jgi:OFA family oxalate/formate antiporter-like MFS transporter
LFGSAVLLLALGLVYGWSIFVSPLEAEFGWTRARTSLAFSLCVSMFCLGGIVTGLAAKKYSPGAVVAVCPALVGLVFFGVSKLTTLGRLYFL